MVIRKMLWILGVSLSIASGVNAQSIGGPAGAPSVLPAAPTCCAPACAAPACVAPTTVTLCVRTTGAKKCCAWNNLLERLTLHHHCNYKIQCQGVPCAPACPAPCPVPCAQACPAPCAQACPAPCAPVCDNSAPTCVNKEKCQADCTPAVTCVSAYPVVTVTPATAPVSPVAPVAPLAAVAPLAPVAPVQQVATPVEPPLVAVKSVDPALSYFQAMQASQAADARAFKQLMDKRMMTMAAMRAMQQNDMQAMGQLETVLRQSRAALSPVPIAVPVQTPVPVKEKTTPAATEQPSQQIETLGRMLSDLNRDIKLLSDKVEQIQK